MHQNPSSSVAGVSAPETVSGCIFVHDWNRSAFSACGKRPERAIAGVAPTRILRRAGEYRAGAAALHRALERLACNAAAPALYSPARRKMRSEEHTSELQSHVNLVCRLL